MAAAVTPQAEALARLAHEETGYGVVADKIQKNLFASEKVHRFIKPIKTVGVIQRLEDRKVIEIAEPFGVVCAIVPSTNPTSTAIYKILIAVKARCPIVISPHPAAVRCITRVAEIMNEAARKAGAPDGTAAPRLAQARADVDLLDHCWEQVVQIVLGLAGIGWAHGDLSAYNLLLDGEVVLAIDMPQVVDVVERGAVGRAVARDRGGAGGADVGGCWGCNRARGAHVWACGGYGGL